MSWRVVATDSAQPDFDRLSEPERTALAEGFFEWVEVGPPRTNPRSVAGAELFEDEVGSRFVATYFVDEAEQYVAIVRVRRR